MLTARNSQTILNKTIFLQFCSVIVLKKLYHTFSVAIVFRIAWETTGTKCGDTRLINSYDDNYKPVGISQRNIYPHAYMAIWRNSTTASKFMFKFVSKLKGIPRIHIMLQTIQLVLKAVDLLLYLTKCAKTPNSTLYSNFIEHQSIVKTTWRANGRDKVDRSLRITRLLPSSNNLEPNFAFGSGVCVYVRSFEPNGSRSKQ